MSLRKSLGYSPIGEIGGTNSSNDFSFIIDRSDRFAVEEQLVMEREIPKTSMRYEEKEVKVKKKVASYYLSISLINKLKQFAKYHDVTYSSVVEKAVQKFLDNGKV